MGSFQSKKKYDVAIGESTIKSKSQPARNDIKPDYLIKIAQHSEKLHVPQSDLGQNHNGVQNCLVEKQSTIEEEQTPVPIEITQKGLQYSSDDNIDQIENASDKNDDENFVAPSLSNIEINTATNQQEEKLINTELEPSTQHAKQLVEPLINETFINEERLASLVEMEDHKDLNTKENVTKSDENIHEHEAITVLNDVIKEASDCENLDNQLPPENGDTIKIEGTVPEPSRKRGMIGDPPTEEEITSACEKPADVKSEVQTISTTLGVSECSDNQHGSHGTKISSHICLESVDSDDVNNTLDKLQLMEEEIHSTRARILSIKEID